MEGGGTDSQGEEGLTRNWTRGGDVEGSGGDFKSPAHGLHHLSQITTWVLGRSRDRYRNPQGQDASVARGREGGGPVRNITQPTKGV